MEDNSNNTQEVVKKKRGRKPKNKTNDQPNEIQTQEEKSENIEKPAPKKRGRKPKGGKIIVNDPKPIQSNVIKQNVILHLKCNLKDINDDKNAFFNSINELQTNSKTAPLEYEIINKNNNCVNHFGK